MGVSLGDTLLLYLRLSKFFEGCETQIMKILENTCQALDFML